MREPSWVPTATVTASMMTSVVDQNMGPHMATSTALKEREMDLSHIW